MRLRRIGWATVAGSVAIGAICLFLLAPIIIVVITAFSSSKSLAFPPPGFSLRWFEAFLGNRSFVDSALLSIRLGLLVTGITLTVGTFAAVAIARGTFRGAEALRTLVASPLIVPYVVLGLGLLIYLSALRVPSSIWTLTFAHSVVALPFVVRIVSAGLQSYDSRVEESARSLGANRVRAFTSVTLPLIRGSLVAAAVFAFITSFDEVTVTLFVSGPDTTTLPVRVFNYIEFTSDPLISAVSAIEVVLSVVVVIIVDRLVGFTKFL